MSWSSHAPTGEEQKAIISPNEYSPQGRRTNYPNQFSCYVQRISAADGNFLVTETHQTGDLIGNKLYLYHRPTIDPDGRPLIQTISDGTLDYDASNARQGYLVFSVNPTSEFSVQYRAAPDTVSPWQLNVLADDVMELQQQLGINALTGYAGLKNLAYALFDTPANPNIADVALRAVYLSHLGRDIVIGSTDNVALQPSLGTSHLIQLGRSTDRLTFDTTGFLVTQSNGTLSTAITLGTKTGDSITYKGQVSGEGPMTVGGPGWPNHSGTLGGDVDETFYNNAMLRVRGDAAFLGDVKAVGSITVVNLTGEVSTFYGDLTVSDELTVQGQAHLVGGGDASSLTINNTLSVKGNLVAGNEVGAGGSGQTLLDGLDASEIAHTYRTVTKKTLPYTVLGGRPALGWSAGKKALFGGHYTVTGYANLAGDQAVITGFANATAGPSGEHPNVVQVNLQDHPVPVITGEHSTLSSDSGVWSMGWLDPGMLWIRDNSTRFESPIYGYTVEETTGTTGISRLNVFCPKMVESNRVQTDDPLVLFNPYSRPYDFVSAVGGSSPTATVFASTEWPFEVAFDGGVSKITSSVSSISLGTALSYSITGSTQTTGRAFIFAQEPADPELPPLFEARAVPYGMPNEVAVGEVIASVDGSSWTIVDTVSYRPKGVYDSGWLVASSTLTGDGSYLSLTGAGQTIYFRHELGADTSLATTSIDLYLGTYGSALPGNLPKTNTLAHSIQGRDERVGGSGTFTRIPLNSSQPAGGSSEREASLCFLDSQAIGININSNLLDAVTYGGETTPAPRYVRLVMRRDA